MGSSYYPKPERARERDLEASAVGGGCIAGAVA